MECPYTKLMTSSDGRSMSTLTKNRVKAGGVEHKLSPEPGTFELGKVGVGMEHEMLIDESWSGSLHAFRARFRTQSRRIRLRVFLAFQTKHLKCLRVLRRV